MASHVKIKLKQAREAIGQKNYAKARDLSLGILELDQNNYNANVFLGVAYLNLKEYAQSEQAYRAAIALSPDQSLAWQGLHKLYNETRNWSGWLETSGKLATLYAAADDATKCAEIVQEIIKYYRREENGSPLQFAQALSLYLPGSLFYSTLATLPAPDPTNPALTTTFDAQSAIHNSLPILEELVAIYEKSEDAWSRNEVEKRRTRLNAPPVAQIRKDVAIEVISGSQLPRLYNEVINHPNTSDELRRETEGKLLRMKQRHLFALSSSSEPNEKSQLASELNELIRGIVLLEIPDELAWTLAIEAHDAASIEDYDYGMLHQFSELFPQSPLAKMVLAYFEYSGIHVEKEDDDDKTPRKLTADDEFDNIEIMMEAFNSLGDSILAHRIIAELYEHDADYENAIKVAESALGLVRRVEKDWGKPLKRVRKSFNITLGTSLVHHFPPKYHTRALRIIDDLLVEDPDNIPSLMGKGFILGRAKKWADASIVFARVVQLISDDMDHGIRAKEEHAWCEMMCGHPEVAADELQSVIDVLDKLEGKTEDKARCWWRRGRCYWEMSGDYKEDAYKHFVTALKRSSVFAPAFTSLGIYYSDHSTPPDPSRASKCFQKAFELDPREAEAARRLAEGFAEEGEWDLVEVVSRRTIEGEGGLEDGPTVKASRRYLPLNAWAWKAVGAVELNRRNFALAIEALQIALRTDVDDHSCWLRLGEAYSKAGRYAAALKALEHARELEPSDWVTSYFIGEVQRQMGAHEEAIRAFELILKTRPQELGVLHSLGQTYMDLGRLELSAGFSARAETSFMSTIEVTLKLINASSGFRRVAWKAIGDALFHLSAFSALSDKEAVQNVVSSVLPLIPEQPSAELAAVVTLPISLEDTASVPLSILQVAMIVYDYRLTLGGIDDAAKGTAHFDLGTSLSTFVQRSLDSNKGDRALEQVIGHFKQAIRLEPANDIFWVALGNATFLSQPSLCQHSFVRALEIDGKNAATWTSLGMLYMQHEDIQLANEAFLKAQTLDSDYALAWVGQGLAAAANGHQREASALFEHASGLTASVPEADLEYATRLFRRINASTTSSRTVSSEAFLPAFFVLDRYCKQRPQDAAALHLFGLVCERVGHAELGLEAVERAIVVLEAIYEETEDPIIERRFATAHANAARLKLTLADYEGALESYQTTMGLLTEQAEGGESGEYAADTTALLTQSQFGSGLAHFNLGQLAEALPMFEAAMEASVDVPTLRGHVVVLLAQTLWAIGTDEAKESAKSQLLQSIEYDPENLMAINTLAGMGVLTEDDGLVDAALSELLSLPLDQRRERDPEREVTYLLIQHSLGQGDVNGALSVAQKAVFAEPANVNTRHRLASVTLQRGSSKAALAILSDNAETCTDFAQSRVSQALQATALCRGANEDGESGSEAVRLAQKGVMLSPWELRELETLAYVRCCSALA